MFFKHQQNSFCFHGQPPEDVASGRPSGSQDVQGPHQRQELCGHGRHWGVYSLWQRGQPFVRVPQGLTF